MLYLRLLHHETQLAGAVERHRRDGDAAGLEHGKPACRQHRRIRAAQEHAIARLEHQIFGKHARDPIGRRAQLRVGPERRGREHAAILRPAALDVRVQELAGEVHALRIVEPEHVDDLRHRLAQGKAFLCEPIDVGSGARYHASNVCLAMTSCWISLAPS